MVDIESLRDYCLAKKATEDGFPFDEKILVFKVMGKIFALMNVDNFSFINLKCDPERAVLLRESHDAITAGYHMSKKHWNSVYVDGRLPDQLILDLIDHSYDMVVNTLTKKDKLALQNEY